MLRVQLLSCSRHKCSTNFRIIYSLENISLYEANTCWHTALLLLLQLSVRTIGLNIHIVNCVLNICQFNRYRIEWSMAKQCVKQRVFVNTATGDAELRWYAWSDFYLIIYWISQLLFTVGCLYWI
jgi:hypothetical protein